MCWVQVPPIGYRLALKDYQQCVRNSNDCGDGHDESDGPDMYWDDRDAQQEEPDGDFEYRSRYGIEHLAKEPVVKCDLRILICNVFTMLSGTMDSSTDLAR